MIRQRRALTHLDDPFFDPNVQKRVAEIIAVQHGKRPGPPGYRFTIHGDQAPKPIEVSLPDDTSTQH